LTHHLSSEKRLVPVSAIWARRSVVVFPPRDGVGAIFRSCLQLFCDCKIDPSPDPPVSNAFELPSARCQARQAPDAKPLEQDDFSSNRHPALSFYLSMIFSENRYPLFRIML
jgi:hypothetical protein